jgi:MmgE/PrpD N-terminal domain
MSMISPQTTHGFDTLDSAQVHSISEQLAAFTTSLALSEIPSPVIQHAKLHILDAVGVGLAASRFDFAKTALAGIQCLGESGQIPVIGFPVKLCVRDAALLTGILIHGLDFDDTHLASIVHPSASALAAALSAGTAHHASGSEALLAYLAAVETITRLGCAVAGDFHRVGLHPTGLLGAFSCVLAVGRVAGLNAKQMTDAQGIVLSMAGGSLEFLEEGTWTKRLHPGWAERSAPSPPQHLPARVLPGQDWPTKVGSGSIACTSAPRSRSISKPAPKRWDHNGKCCGFASSPIRRATLPMRSLTPPSSLPGSPPHTRTDRFDHGAHCGRRGGNRVRAATE